MYIIALYSCVEAYVSRTHTLSFEFWKDVHRILSFQSIRMLLWFEVKRDICALFNALFVILLTVYLVKR